MPDKPTHSPYGFVPLPKAGPERAAFPGWRRDAGISGVLSCELEALGPLFTADHRSERPIEPGDRHLLLRFLRNGAGAPIIQGASLRGMLRAVFEAAFPSCLPLAAAAGKSKRAGKDAVYQLAIPDEYRHGRCAEVGQLCPACRLFGVIQGDEVHAAGRVRVSDAVLALGSALTEETVRLAELSSPKPHHYPIYSATGAEGGPIRGRKLYFHHPAAPPPGVDPALWSDRSHAIAEFAAAGTRFTFRVQLHNLTDEEVRRLLACLTLDAGHAHKLGMAKPLGYGSCAIHVSETGSQLAAAASRYRGWGASGRLVLAEWPAPEGWLSGELEELLRREPPPGSVTGYLGFKDYRGQGVDRHGRYVTLAAGPATRQRPPAERGGGRPAPAHFAAPPAAQPAPRPPQPPEPLRRQKGDQIKVEVMAAEAGTLRLRDLETGQDDIVFKAMVPWKTGDQRKVHVDKASPDGKVLKVRA